MGGAGKFVALSVSLLVLLACGLLAGTRLEKPVQLVLVAAASLLMAVFSVLRLVKVYRCRHDERKRAQAIWSGRIDPL